MHIDKDLVAASATPLVLSILAEDGAHGYAILQRIRDLSDGRFDWKDGMLYPLLHRLERQGLVTSRWIVSPEGRRRKVYRVTDEGRAALRDRRQQWSLVIEVLERSWRDGTGRSPSHA